jgi:2,5-diketo-D-gluconate reductase B
MVPNIALNNGVKIPILGLGTWELTGKKCEEAVKAAIHMGYRHIDTADYYKNHKNIGTAIRGFDRKELFITTKVMPPKLGYDDVLEAFERFLKELGTDYADLLLIHWRGNVALEETFRAFEKLQDENKIRAAGVSNFAIEDIDDAKNATNIPITMNQIEFYPGMYPKEVLDYCRTEKITVTAYSPLGRGRVLSNHALTQIAEKYRRTPAQITLRWIIEKNVVVIPKASSSEHLRENLSIFDFKLEKDDARKLDEL